MYFDPMENAVAVTVQEDFSAALALLHSTDIDSAEKLRQMLDVSIARSCGSKKTLAGRIARRDDSTVLTHHELSESGYAKAPDFYRRDVGGTNATIHHRDIIGRAESITASQFYQQNIPNLVVAIDCKTEIPTISIPDDPGLSGAGADGALCKVCNGGGLGPLILLECQECQDVYHPLCHQPPVLDLDIYDPRLVWHCAKCVELSEAAAVVDVDVVTAAEMENSEFQSKGREIIDYGHPAKYLRHHQPPDYFQRRIKTGLNFQHGNGATKRARHFGSNGEPASASSNPSSASSSGLHHQLRKRVGSKLTMTRATAK